MKPSIHILGLDVGAVSVSLCAIDLDANLRHSAYAFHHGSVRATLVRLLSGVDLGRVGWLSCTTSAAPWLPAAVPHDNQVAHIAAARHRHPDLGTLLVVGGEKFGLFRFDAHGAYREARANSSCAAGTGSFLDQLAETLGLSGSAELAAIAAQAGGESPKIASRCAVFAKTDLIHAQQQGYRREAICNGLCAGLAAIIADTLFAGEPASGPVVFAGGVARNAAVRAHLAQRLGCPLVVDEAPELHAALGAALLLRERLSREAAPQRPALHPPVAAEALLAEPAPDGRSRHAPLDLRLSSYPDFAAHRSYAFVPAVVAGTGPVEVDDYLAAGALPPGGLALGLDIGSTSTKAALLDAQRQVVAGFYTRTAGQPLAAVQALFEAISGWRAGRPGAPAIRGVATTGAGRRFIATLVGADLVLDEITAHARAAIELVPDVDTILEIGGQDSKFTTLRHGRVTSATMNTVCAAGTGSFIEEQARRLRCPLADYARAVEGARAPLVSDRCTVFMQRDVSHLVHEGHTVPEVLAAVLHAVCENYLRRVAREANIGERICFQGATAKNRALVAAFEQRLGRPIFVSRHCHLTGAVGAALAVDEQGVAASCFRGLDLFRASIALGHERCAKCQNQCRLTTAEVAGERVAYGFLCGRDLGTDHYVSRNRSGLDLLKTRRRVEARPGGTAPRPVLGRVLDGLERAARPLGAPPLRDVTLGLPAALQLLEQLPLWRRFFEELGVRVVTSESCESPVTRGKTWARAEFCAPIAAFHGHVEHLASRADYVFWPIQLEAVPPYHRRRRQYCYYTQYSAALLHTIALPGLRERCLTPLLPTAGARPTTPARLAEALRPALGPGLTTARVARAFARAVVHAHQAQEALHTVMERARAGRDDLAVVLLGRPYACLAPQLNKGIPDILGALGIQVFFQDMVRPGPADRAEIDGLLQQVHWHQAARILEAAQVVARTPGLYPVLLSCFKCAPDSCTIEYVKRICDAHDKPYLILELDEHDSSLGYETRIEAAVRAFRNHHAAPPRAAPSRRRALPINPVLSDTLGDRTLFMPNWDALTCRLIAENLNHWGVRTELLVDDAPRIERSLRLNTGQCIPLTIIAQSFIDGVGQRGLDPARTAVWVPSSRVSCNLGMFPAYLKSVLESHGHGFEHAAVNPSTIVGTGLTIPGSIDNYLCHLFGGYLRRMVCRLRPYERRRGATDEALAASLELFLQAFRGERAKDEAVHLVVEHFLSIDVGPRRRPQVAIFGDLYTRDNDVANQDLVRFIEDHGGEVLTTPYSEYAQIIAGSYFRKWLREAQFGEYALGRSVMAVSRRLERRYVRQFERVVGPCTPVPLTADVDGLLAPFQVTHRHTGESFDNLLKVFHLVQEHPDLALFVQANPSYCCPSLVSEALQRDIEVRTGVPVVTVTYDGTAVSRNEVLVPYLTWPRRLPRAARATAPAAPAAHEQPSPEPAERSASGPDPD